MSEVMAVADQIIEVGPGEEAVTVGILSATGPSSGMRSED
jgi:hypothetical protein